MASVEPKLRPKNILIAHGGEWSAKDRMYIGCEEELILIPPSGPIYTDLLRRIQARIMKPKSKYVYKVVALMESATGAIVKMKITDDFELAYVLDELKAPTLYISTLPIANELLEAVNDHAAMLTNVTNPMSNSFAGGKKILSPDLDNSLDKNLDNNVHVDVDTNLNDSERVVSRHSDSGFEWNTDWGNQDNEIDWEDVRDPFMSSGHTREDDLESLENIPTSTLGSSSILRSAASLGSRNDVFEGDHEYVGQWIIPGASFHMMQPKTQDLLLNEGIGDETLCKGALFSSKEKLVTLLGLYHLSNHISFDTPRSCTKRYGAYCKSKKENCSIVCRALALGKAWSIEEWHPHTCEKYLRFHAEPTISSKVLGTYFVPNLMTKGVVLRPSDIQSMVKKKFGAKIQCQTVLAARNHALTMVYGDSNESFEKLPKYLWMIEYTNPGSVTELKVNETDGRFKYCFMALGAYVDVENLDSF